MSELDQVFRLLWGEEEKTFWEDDQYNRWSLNMPGSMSVNIGQKGQERTLVVVTPDGNKPFFPETFPSVREAKAALRMWLERRWQELKDQS